MVSDAVKRALEWKTDIANHDWHTEAIRRVMRRTATLTSYMDAHGERDPRDFSNLLTLEKRNGTRALTADREKWIDGLNTSVGDTEETNRAESHCCDCGYPP